MAETPQNTAVTPHNPLEGPRPDLSINLQDGSEEQVSIIIVHKDRPEYLNILLQSISVNSTNNNYEIIVSDNASGKETQDFLDEVGSEIKVVRNEKNLFWSGAANKGVAAANKQSKYFVFLHSDVVVLSPGWLDYLINVAEQQKSGYVGVDLHSYHMGGQKVEFIQEWCVLMSRECFDKIGPWPEELPLVGSGFIMSMRAQVKDQKPQIMRNPIVHHYKIFGIDVNEYERLTEQAMTALPRLLREAQSNPLR